MNSLALNRKSLLNGIFISLLLTGFFVYLYAVTEPMLHFHMQQNPYFNDAHFYQQHAQRVGGLGSYLSNYLMQAFDSNLRGSLTIILLISILPLSLAVLRKSLRMQVPVLLYYVPVALAATLFHDYYFPLTILVQIVVLYLAVLIYGFVQKFRFYGMLTSLVMYAMLYYVFGSGTALIFGLSCILLNFFQTGIRQAIIKGIITLVLLALLPYLAYHFFFNLSPTQAFFQFLPELPVTLTYQKSVILYLFIGSMPVLLLTGLLNTKFKLSQKLTRFTEKPFYHPVGHLALIVLSFWLIDCTANEHAKNVAKIDWLTYHQQWDESIVLAKHDATYEFLTNLNFNRSVNQSGQLLEQFFDYPQLLGIKALSPDNLGTAFYSIQASEYYFDLNYITRSQHLAYAALVLEPYNARVLKQLVLTNLVLGNKRAAQTYLRVLSSNRHHAAFVDRYASYLQDETAIANDPVLTEKRRLMPENFAIPMHIINRLEDLIVKDSTNQSAWEHLQLCYLLEHRLDDFMNHFTASMQFYPRIPELYEQALLVYIYSTRSNLELSRSISNASKEKFTAFLQKLKDYNNNLEIAREHLTEFENSYIYYMKYFSPKVTNLEVITKK